MNERILDWRFRLVLAVISGLLVGIPAAFLSQGVFILGWLSSALLISISIFCLLSAWLWSGGGRALSAVMILAFVLRLVIGAGMQFALPAWGYDEPSQEAGYLYYDAYERDNEAWVLAKSEHPIWASFTAEFSTDQYGGLLSISAFVYRYLSPDAHRPFLVLILAAFFATLGLPFFYQTLAKRWNTAIAGFAVWILALYPENLFLGSSQMREPFVIGLLCIAFWAVSTWQKSSENKRLYWIFFASVAGMLVISSKVAVMVTAMLLVIFWMDNFYPKKRVYQVLSIGVLGLGVIAAAYLNWHWLHIFAGYDLALTEASSGWLQVLIGQLGESLRTPFLVAYGVFRPVLPAAIAQSAIPLLKSLVVLRALGWYALAPFLIYSFFVIWKSDAKQDKRVLIWTALMIIGWIIISSYRAGGDGNDNPRYRTFFLPWMAMLASWGWYWAKAHKNLWLRRFILMEVVFLTVFTNWYAYRYFHVGIILDMKINVAIILVSSLVIVVGGAVRDYRNKIKRIDSK
jgi:hypothetical protein